MDDYVFTLGIEEEFQIVNPETRERTDLSLYRGIVTA